MVVCIAPRDFTERSPSQCSGAGVPCAECWLVDIRYADQPCTMIAHVGDVYGEVVRDGALDVQGPSGYVRIVDVGINSQDAARLRRDDGIWNGITIAAGR